MTTAKDNHTNRPILLTLVDLIDPPCHGPGDGKALLHEIVLMPTHDGWHGAMDAEGVGPIEVNCKLDGDRLCGRVSCSLGEAAFRAPIQWNPLWSEKLIRLGPFTVCLSVTEVPILTDGPQATSGYTVDRV